MRLRYQLYGGSPSLAFLAARLAEAGSEVQVFRSSTKLRLRPMRLASPVLRELAELYKRNGDIPAHLSRSPRVQSWGLPGGKCYDFVIRRAADRWVDPQELEASLWDLARRLGARIEHARLMPFPKLEPGVRQIVDLDIEEVGHWPDNSFVPNTIARRVEVTEIWLPHGRLDQATGSAQFVLLEGTLCYLEPHPKQGYAASFYSGSRYAVERALRAVRAPRGVGPTLWRALFSMNAGAREHGFSTRMGLSSLYVPGVFMVGAALGRSSPISNLHDSEAFYQARRLFETLSFSPAQEDAYPLRLSESWRKNEQRRFHSAFRKTRAWERLLFSNRSQKWVLSVSTLMPSLVRRFLKSPV